MCFHKPKSPKTSKDYSWDHPSKNGSFQIDRSIRASVPPWFPPSASVPPKHDQVETGRRGGGVCQGSMDVKNMGHVCHGVFGT